MRTLLETLKAEKRQLTVNFPAAHGGKLVTASGIIVEVGDDYFLMADIYGNHMLVPTASVAYIEIKK